MTTPCPDAPRSVDATERQFSNASEDSCILNSVKSAVDKPAFTLSCSLHTAAAASVSRTDTRSFTRKALLNMATERELQSFKLEVLVHSRQCRCHIMDHVGTSSRRTWPLSTSSLPAALLRQIRVQSSVSPMLQRLRGAYYGPALRGRR